MATGILWLDSGTYSFFIKIYTNVFYIKNKRVIFNMLDLQCFGIVLTFVGLWINIVHIF